MIEYVMNDKFTRRAELRRGKPQAGACPAWVVTGFPQPVGLALPYQAIGFIETSTPPS